jgi:precorrin-2 dehydrogenase/sirohydrochlorin ferrochelatase/precorrin-6A/cobalt-precorrin-6A reductase
LESGLPIIYSVATEYGAELAGLSSFSNLEIYVKRMDVEEMEKLMKSRSIAGVIDATHPYAVEFTRNIRLACESLNLPYIRVLRKASNPDAEDIVSVPSCEAAVETLRHMEGNVLLTIGGKELDKFTSLPDYRERLYVRILPDPSTLESCKKLGFDAKHILAMQGPFSEKLNAAILEMIDAKVLVTKDGGTAGGLSEKIYAAFPLGVQVVLITRPQEAEIGYSVEEAVTWARRLLRMKGKQSPLFPLFTDIDGRPVVLIGGGKVAARRARTLLTCGARVTAVSPSFDPAFDDPALRDVERVTRPYREGDLKGAVMVVIATNDRNENHKVGQQAQKAGIFVSVADAPEEGTFFFPAFVAEREVAAAISTGGYAPSLSRRLASRLREVWRDWVREEKEREEEETGK